MARSEQAWGQGADWRTTPLISRKAEGSSSGACSHAGSHTADTTVREDTDDADQAAGGPLTVDA